MNNLKCILNLLLLKKKIFSKKESLNLCNKLILLFFLILFISFQVNAQKGLFVKFSVGSGFTTEYSIINKTGFSIVTKNHSIGWGITDNFAVQIGEFGGLNKLKAGTYDYINLDAFGLGFCYKTPVDLKISILGAYSKVSLAHKWSEAEGDDGGNGFGFNMSVDKEWFVAKRLGIRVGPHLYWLKTSNSNYKFFNMSINGSLVFYLTPVR